MTEYAVKDDPGLATRKLSECIDVGGEAFLTFRLAIQTVSGGKYKTFKTRKLSYEVVSAEELNDIMEEDEEFLEEKAETWLREKQIDRELVSVEFVGSLMLSVSDEDSEAETEYDIHGDPLSPRGAHYIRLNGELVYDPDGELRDFFAGRSASESD